MTIDLKAKAENLCELAARLGASQCVVADTRSGRVLMSAGAKHALMDQLLASPADVKRLDSSLSDQELPSLWGQGSDELIVCRPEQSTIVALLFESLGLAPVALYRFSKDVAAQVQATWSGDHDSNPIKSSDPQRPTTRGRDPARAGKKRQ